MVQISHAPLVGLREVIGGGAGGEDAADLLEGAREDGASGARQTQRAALGQRQAFERQQLQVLAHGADGGLFARQLLHAARRVLVFAGAAREAAQSLPARFPAAGAAADDDGRRAARSGARLGVDALVHLRDLRQLIRGTQIHCVCGGEREDLKDVSSAHRGCVYMMKNTLKTAKL